jgi:hypothetical protein
MTALLIGKPVGLMREILDIYSMSKNKSIFSNDNLGYDIVNPTSKTICLHRVLKPCLFSGPLPVFWFFLFYSKTLDLFPQPVSSILPSLYYCPFWPLGVVRRF